MLALHHRKNSQLGEVGFAPQYFFDADKFLRRQAMPGHNFRRDLRVESSVQHRSMKLPKLRARSNCRASVPANANPPNRVWSKRSHIIVAVIGGLGSYT